MTLKIIHKNNTSAGQAPAPSDLDIGEIAVNSADAELYTKDTNGNIRKFQNTTTATADGVQFTQTGTSAVQRTVESKLQDVVSVKDFGAIGDGVTDDTNAIQAALNSSKNVYLPTGNYLVSRAIRVNDNRNLCGAGKNNSFIRRTDSTSETIAGQSVKAVIWVSGRYASIKDVGIVGDRSGTSAELDGIFCGSPMPNNSVFLSIQLRNLNRGVYGRNGAYMCIFDQVTCHSCLNGIDFSFGAPSTSLTFNSCWMENCGQAYDFSEAVYCVMNSCGADWANYTSLNNPYGVGFGSRASSKGIYNFGRSVFTLNGCGAEKSFGNGIFRFSGACSAVINSPHQASCSSEYVPDYSNYGNVAVGPIQCDVIGSLNAVTINSVKNLETWTNTKVATEHPGKPIASLLAFNYLESNYGASDRTAVVITGVSTADEENLIKGIASKKYCISTNALRRNPEIFGTFTQGSVVTDSVSIQGSGTVIEIPFIAQGSQNIKHFLRITGTNRDFNSNITLPFSAEIGVASLNSLVNVSSGNLLGVSSVTINGMNLLITLPQSVTNPILRAEIMSERASLVNLAGASIT